MKTFRTLDLAVEFYDKADRLKLKGHLRDQLLRGSSSIASNLSEGNAKFPVDEKKRFYQIAYASLQECKTTLKLTKCEDKYLLNMAEKMGAWIYNLWFFPLRGGRRSVKGKK